MICLMDSQRSVTDMGGTMRLGAYPARLRAGLARARRRTASRRSASATAIATRSTTPTATCSPKTGMRFSGVSPDGNLVEIIELPEHPWFVGCQFHPELKSRPTRAHPLFAAFVRAAVERRGR